MLRGIHFEKLLSNKGIVVNLPICCWFKTKSLTNAFSGSKVILLVFARLILGKFKPISHLEHKYLDKSTCVDQERVLSAGPHLVILIRPELPKSLHFVPISPINSQLHKSSHYNHWCNQNSVAIQFKCTWIHLKKS